MSPVDVEVGSIYLVPSVILDGKIIPILLPAHTDNRETCSGDVPKHFHVDRRFCNSSAKIALLHSACYGHGLREMSCLREDSKLKEPSVFALERLHKIYENAEVKDNECPHRGLQLINKCGTCPGHGLIFENNRLKYKRPFFLVNGKNSGLLSDGECKIKIVEDCLDVTVFEMQDALGRIYPDATFKVNGFNMKVGDVLHITSKDC